MQSEIVLVFSKGFISESKAFNYIVDLINNVVNEQHEAIKSMMGDKSLNKITFEIQKLKERINDNNYESFKIKHFYPDPIFILNQTNNIFVAMPLTGYIQCAVADMYKKTHLEYSEIAVRYYESVYGASTETLLIECPTSPTMDMLDAMFTPEVVQMQIFNVLNHGKRIITTDMVERSTDYFTGTLEERNEKFKKFLAGEDINFDGKAFIEFKEEIKQELFENSESVSNEDNQKESEQKNPDDVSEHLEDNSSSSDNVLNTKTSKPKRKTGKHIKKD